jgi:hypothetical protein
MTEFQAASEADPKQGQAWYWQGIVMLKGHQINQVGQLARVWDKALSLGSLIAITACHERGLQPCERGKLMLSQKFVSFSQGNTQTFNVPPQQTEPGQIQNNASFAHVAYRFNAGGKNYTFDFVPSTWSTCKFDLVVQCPQMGYAEQLIITQYVAQTLPKLASGAFEARAQGETPAGPEPSAAQPHTADAGVPVSDAPVNPAPATQAAATSIRQIDFHNFRYPSGCSKDDPGYPAIIPVAGGKWEKGEGRG